MKSKKVLKSDVIKSNGNKFQAHGTKLFIGLFPKPVRLVTPAEIQAIQSHFNQEIVDLLNDRSVNGVVPHQEGSE